MAQVSPQVMFLVFFVYGLAWFVMGLAVALESRRTTALPLASSLKYLAAFGIVHAAVEWLDMGLLVWDPGAAAFSWRVGRTLAMAVSTLFLALFGASLISVNTGGYRWLRWMSLGLFGVWLLAVVPRHPGAPGAFLGLEEGWLGSADIVARYLLYLPGCLLAGLAMAGQGRWFRRHGYFQGARDSLVVAGAFFFNAIVAGVIVPHGSYFPASVLNYDSFFEWVRVPPQVFRALSALVIAFFLVRVLNVFEMERQRQLEKANRERLEAQEKARSQLEKWIHKLETKTRELMSLVRASEALVSTAGPETLLYSVVATAAQTFGADVAVLFLWDAPSGSLRARAATGYDLRSLSQVALRPGEAIAGKVFQTGEAAYSNNPADADGLLGDLSAENRRLLNEARGGIEPRAFLCVPLETRGQVLGSLLLATFREGVAFSSSNLELARIFSRLASALLEKLRLLQEASQAEALRRADQLRTEFLANISHELQTPLASLKASLDFLAPALSGQALEAQAMLAENARRSTERLQKLVSDLLDVTRLQNLRLKLERDILDLGGVMEQAVENLAPLMAQKGQELKLSIPNGSLLVLGDRRRMEQVLGNLLVNAHQYTPEGGRVTLSALERGDKIVISVADTGPGIPPAERDQLFERFYRGPSGQRPSGLGLGLAIAKGIVELHGGKIWVESEPGEGSVFSFSLPKAHSDEDPHH